MCAHVLQESGQAGRYPGDAILAKISASALSACLNIVASWIVRSAERKVLGELAKEERLLSDIGLTREQALREAGKPFWQP